MNATGPVQSYFAHDPLRSYHEPQKKEIYFLIKWESMLPFLQ